MKKKILITLVAFTVIMVGVLLYSTGGKMGGIFLDEYSVSEDGSQMTLKVGVASSVGYVRTFKERQQDNKKYITFYSTYGLNSKIGADNEFTINLDQNLEEIYFYRGEEGYVLLLQKKNEANTWQLVR